MEGGSDGTETATDTESGSDETADREPMRDSLRYAIGNTPEQANFNPWAQDNNGTGIYYIRQLHATRNVETAEKVYNPTFEAPWHPDQDEITIPTWYAGYEVEQPYDIWEQHTEGLTYWDGTPIDAEARLLHQQVEWFNNDNKFAEGATFNHEVVSQWEYRRWWDRGETLDGENIEGQQPDPQGRPILENEAAPADGDLAIHPSFTEPYVEEFEDASSADAVTTIQDDLHGDRISLHRWAEEDLGSGLYQIESPDDINSERVQMSIYEDHPAAEQANVPNLEILFASQDRQQILVSQGDVDLEENVITEEGGEYTREQVPDHMQELSRWLQLGGDKWLFNWNNPHLENLWVRRALVTAVDWTAVGENGWGAERSVPITHQTGLLDPVSEGAFSSDFLDSLHTWPMEADQETAAEYMQNAGYERQGNQWVDADGNSFELDLTATTGIQDHIGAAQTIQANLQSFGVGINYTGQDDSTWQNNMDIQNNPSLNYDTTVYWHGQSTPFEYYWTQGAWWSEPLIGGDPNDDVDSYEVDYEDSGDQTRDTQDTQGKPLQVQIPEEPGVIEAPDEAGPNPDIGGREIDLARIVHKIREPIDESEYQDLIEQCAIYYNYYLPDFVFHQYTYGAFGNVRDFEWPASDHPVMRHEHSFAINDVLMQGGVVQPSYDDDYTER